MVGLPEELAQRQLDAYNSKDLDAFVACYTEDVEVYDYPNTCVFKGRDELGERYGKLFETYPQMEARLVGRMALERYAIDHEEVRRKPEDEPFFAVAIYTIRDGLISEVRFIK